MYEQSLLSGDHQMSEMREVSDDFDGPGPTKKAKRESRYQKEWQSHGMLPSTRGPTFARCKYCITDVNIGHGGVNDVKKHLATAKHRENAKVVSSSRTMPGFFQQSSIDDKITRAEVLFSNFIAEHNLSFMTANHFTHLTSAMFPDSKVAQAFSCARTKTTCIVKRALHPHFSDPIIASCKENLFSIMCDEGNDVDDKNFAILVRLWDNELGKPVTRFLDMPVCNKGTAENLFDLIDASVTEREIAWSNVGFESDTTNVMVGKHNSVLSRVKTKQPKVYSQGCVCHLSNLCLLAGVKVLPVDIDDFFVDLFYYFEKSAKRKEEFREFQEFTDTKKLKIIKHCKTLWLSLERVVQRVLQQWFALYAYFDHISESDQSSRVVRLNQHVTSHLTKLVLLFLEFALDSMSKFNAVFQLSMPLLPALKREVKPLLKILLGRFMKADAIVEAESDLATLDLTDASLQLPDKDLGIGHTAWAYLSDEEDFLEQRTKKQFFRDFFYIAVASTIVKKFNFDDDVVDDVVFVLPENQSTVHSAAVVRMAKRFPAAVAESNLDALEEEVLDYKLEQPGAMPSVYREEGKPTKSAELCVYWQEVGQMQTLCGISRFPHLTRLAKCILSLPVSNADTERVFSTVRKIVTDYRTEMEQSTLCALLSCKLNSNYNCYELETPKELLKQAKVSTMEYNKAHSSKEHDS